MKFCPVVPEICHGQVHGARKEKKNKKNKNKNKNNNNNNKKRSKNNKSPKLCLGDLIISLYRSRTDIRIYNKFIQIQDWHQNIQ